MFPVRAIKLADDNDKLRYRKTYIARQGDGRLEEGLLIERQEGEWTLVGLERFLYRGKPRDEEEAAWVTTPLVTG